MRVELFDDRALQHELSRLKAQYNGSVWMDSVLNSMRAAWDAGQQAAYARHLRSSSALATAPRPLTARPSRPTSAASASWTSSKAVWQEQPRPRPAHRQCAVDAALPEGAAARALPRALPHDVDMVSCHPTLMLQVVRKMVASGAIQWSAALNKLAEYGTALRHAQRHTLLDIRNTSIKTWDSSTWVWIFSRLHTAATDEQTFAR